jgi:hypothetical protein
MAQVLSRLAIDHHLAAVVAGEIDESDGRCRPGSRQADRDGGKPKRPSHAAV